MSRFSSQRHPLGREAAERNLGHHVERDNFMDWATHTDFSEELSARARGPRHLTSYTDAAPFSATAAFKSPANFQLS